MDPGNHSGLVASPEMAMPGNLDILAQTAASQSVDTGSLQDNSSFSGISVLRLSENAPVTLPLLNQPIRIEGQPGGPMLSQPQIQKLLGSSEPDKGLSPGPLSIITTTGFSEPGQPSPASLAQNAQILQYRQSVTSGDAMLSAINYSDSEILHENFDNLGNLDDGLLGGMGNPSRLSENPTSETFNLFDGDGDSLTMEALSPGLIISDSGGLAGVNTVTDSNDSNPGDPSLADDKKKPARPKKPLKGQVSPGKGGALECNQCHKVFNNTSALAKHKLTHSDERKYVCTICEKKFKRQDHLNGHLMTHRDKKPYQCMVTGCDKSYCDARSLRRHLENHHHHTSEQIATEMVAAQSTAADVLAEVTMVPSAKSSLTGSAPTNNNVVKSSSNSAVQLTESTPVRVVISDTTKLINIHPSGQAGVATTVSLPINIQVSNKDLNQIAQSTTVIPLETVLKQQHTQLVQEAGKKDKSTSEQNSTEILARIQQFQLEQQNLVASQLQTDQQQFQEQHSGNNNNSKSSKSSSWQEYKSPPSNIQSPRSGEPSPGYSEMSPAENPGQQVVPTSPVRSTTQLWFNPTSQSHHSGSPPANVTVADAKSVEEMTKPVACNICERRFKNTPALNGHMRLHGGYFKKDAALKEEKKKKGEMAPPSAVPSRSHPTQPQPMGIVRKSKGNAPLHAPPSEEVEEILQKHLKLHALHWQQKQQEQQEQQLQQQIHQELQWQLKRQEQEQKKQQMHQEMRQLQQQQQQQQHQDQVEQQKHQQQIQQELEQQLKHQQQQQQKEKEHNQQKEFQQKLQEQLKHQQEQQKHLLQQKLQEQHQLQQIQQLQQNQTVQELLKQQIQYDGTQQLSALDVQLVQAGVDSHQLEQIKLQLQHQQDKQLQLLFEQQQQQATEQSNSYCQVETSPQVPQSPHLPTSPTYHQSSHVPQSPHNVPSSPLLQRQGSIEHLQSPGVEYNRQSFPQEISEFSGLREGGIDQSLLNDLQIRLQSQNVDLNSMQGISAELQTVSANNGQNINQGIYQSANMNRDRGVPLSDMNFSPSVNIHHNNSAFQTQISGPFVTNGQLTVEPAQLSSSSSTHQTSEIVSQIITSLEDLGEVPPGSMQQIPKQSDPILQSAAGSDSNLHQNPQMTENGILSLKNNSYSEFAHNPVVQNPLAHLGHVQFSTHKPSSTSIPQSSSASSSHILSTSSSTPSATSAQQGSDSRTCVKQELLNYLASKPSSPRAATTSQFSFQFNQTSNSAKNRLASKTSLSPNEHRNSEIKRRLSAGPEDYRSIIQTTGNYNSMENRDFITGRPFKSPLTGPDFKPRMRSKSGDDYNLRQWRNEDQSFMRPKDKTDVDFSHRPRSKTDEHLLKWNNKDMLSRSDGAGMFRNPASVAPASFKIKRKQRPAPLIIPSHANHCGFQSRLRSPRIWTDSQDGINSAPVPYTPPPMLSPSRRGAGLYYSVSVTPQLLGQVNATPSTPRPSLLRSASIPVSKEDSPLLSSSTIPAEEELQPPESDIQPHVNVGPQYQAVLPPFNPNKSAALHEPSEEDLVWEPSVLHNCSEEDVQCYQDLSRSAAVKGNGSNVEHALHILYLAKGDIQKALLMLMSGTSVVPCKHALLSYQYQESDVWSSEEIENYTQALMTHDKDFFNVANEVKTKSVRNCVQFYYLWKKVLVDEHKRLRVVRRRREQLYNLRSNRQQQGTGSDQASEAEMKEERESRVVEEEEEARDDEDDFSTSSSTSALTEDQQISSMDDKDDMECDDITQMMPSPVRIPSPTPTLFSCDYPECNSSFTSKPALNAHHKIHSKLKKPNSSVVNQQFEIGKPKPTASPSRSPIRSEGQEESFPCKLCGRVFSKVKSRSAHMKIHRPDQDKEREKKAKAEKQAKAVLEKSRLDPLTFNTLNVNGPPPPLTH